MDLRHGAALVGLVGVGLGLGPESAHGQLRIGQYDVSVGGGVVLHENASALVPVSPVLTVKGRYLVRPSVGLGFTLDYQRSETDDDVFPLAQFRFSDNDSTVFFVVQQPVAIFHYQANVHVGKDFGRVYADALGGFGGYTVYTDPQSSSEPTMSSEPVRITDFMFSFGGSLRWSITETAGLEISLRDVVYTGYDRDLLYPLRAEIRKCDFGSTPDSNADACQNERFPSLNPVPPDEKSTLHNLILGLSFSFIP